MSGRPTPTMPVMHRRVNRFVNIVVAAIYAVTIVGGAVGEWTCYLLGGLVEAALLALVIRHAWTWRVSLSAAPRPPGRSSASTS